MTADITSYLDLVTSEHRDKPKFIAMISAVAQAFSDTKDVVQGLPRSFDLDYAVGKQLDVVGLWVGISRFVLEPLVGVYFTFDAANLGFDEGVWRGPFDPVDGLVELDDETYRLILRAKIGANHWDGSIPQAYAILDPIFATIGATVLIQDFSDMSMLIGVVGNPLTPLLRSLLLRGFFDLKPVGVRIRGYVFPSFPNAPFFGFDVQNENIAGFDTGAWANTSPPIGPGELLWDGGGSWDSIAFWA